MEAEALMAAGGAIVALVVALKFLGGKTAARERAKNAEEPTGEGIPADQHTGLEDLLEKPGAPTVPDLATTEEEEEAGLAIKKDSIESLLSKPIDAAPSIGAESKTDVKGGLEGIRFEKPHGAEAGLPKEVMAPTQAEQVPEAPAPELPPHHHKNLAQLHEQFGGDFDVDQYGDIIAVPEEKRAYNPPKDIAKNAAEKAAAPRPARMYDKPAGERKENLKRYAMLQYDSGQPPKKVENLLRVRGLGPDGAKAMAFSSYRLWLDKREPLIRGIKETREMAKRVEYKFLKRQIDEATRKQALNDSSMKLAELESKLAASEDYFA